MEHHYHHRHHHHYLRHRHACNPLHHQHRQYYHHNCLTAKIHLKVSILLFALLVILYRLIMDN